MFRSTLKLLLASLVILTLSYGALAHADDPPITLFYQKGHFEPASLAVSANKAFKVAVTNNDSAAIEFESFELHRERVVRPGETITVLIPALAPGNYAFFDDFHQDAPKGVIVAK